MSMGFWDRVSRRLDELSEELLPDQLRYTLDGAREMLRRGDHTGAVAALEKLLAAKPDHATATYLLGEAQLRRGDADRAAKAFEAAMALRAGFTEAQVGLGHARLAQGDAPAAIPLLREALARGAEREVLADAYRGLGRAYLATGQVDKGLRELRKALAEDPADPDAALALAEALLADPARDPEEVRTPLERLARDHAAPPAALAALGRLELRAGRRDAAGKALASALEAGDALPAGARAATLFGLADLARDTRTAHELVLRALAAQPKDPSGHARLARLHLATGSPEAALESFVRAHDLGGGGELLVAAIDAALAAGLDERATDLARRLPGDPRARGLVAAADGDVPAARALLEQALAQRATPETAVRLARLELAAGEPARAATRMLDALRIHPGHLEARRVWEDAQRRALGVAAPAGGMYALATRVHALLLARLGDLAPDAARIVESYDRPLLVTVMGEFSSGKSTFVNAFLGAEVAPVGITPTTATINVLKYGRERGARVIYADDRARDLAWDEVPRVLRAVDAGEARRIRLVEVLYPLEALQRVNIVDTPGLNSILPEHELTARQFIAQADAIVWLFTAGQAGKLSEREALEKIHAEKKRVLGVVNKIDQVSPDEAERILAHLAAELGGLVEALVPVSGRRALAALKADDREALEASSWPKVEAALEERFFAQARALKRDAAAQRLGALLSRARERVAARSRLSTERRDAVSQAAAAARADIVLFQREVVPQEERALGERVVATYRAAAREVLELVRPRRLPFGSHSAAAADRDYMLGFLERALAEATEKTRARVATELRRAGDDAAAVARAAADVVGSGAADEIATHVADAASLVDARVFDRAAAYLRGYLRGGRLDDFFARVLPKLELQEDSVYHALFRDAPDLDTELSRPLAAHAEEALRQVAARLDALAGVAEAVRLEADALDDALGACDDERAALQTV
jgi:tetratricopeptide (TPR) repeat protein/GTP-binding protein EngB required for normal cell division